MTEKRRVGRPRRLDTARQVKEEVVRRLVGTKLAGGPLQPETPEMRLAALLAHYREQVRREQNPYRASFTKFRTELCWTKDEARGGKVCLMPDYPYLREVDDFVIEHTPVLIEKARRTLITWRACAYVLWIAAGGQDARWPQLLESTGNRKCIIAARKLLGENGSAEILGERVRFMVEEFEARGGREKWPDFPTFEWRQDRARASNGSVIAAVPQGADQMRGSGVTHMMLDEFGFWTEARDSMASALQTLQGGGHLEAISTANCASFAADIVAGKIRKRFVGE